MPVKYLSIPDYTLLRSLWCIRQTYTHFMLITKMFISIDKMLVYKTGEPINLSEQNDELYARPVTMANGL